MTAASTKSSQDADRKLVRLQKFLASAGLGSRRHCEEYVESGRVSVDGKPIFELGTQVDPYRQEIRLDGELVKAEAKQYYLFNKPAGCLCTNSDPAGRTRVIDLLPKQGPRLFTVGRLDENSRGLLLVTNDGELAHQLAHPKFRVERKYRVQVAGVPTRETLDTLKRGVRLSDGVFRVRGVRQLAKKGKSVYLELVLTEGQNREIRRLMAHVGHKVMSLQRIAFGPLKLGKLAEGQYRPLKPTELRLLRAILSGKPRSTASRGTRRPGKQSSRRVRGR